MRIIKIRTGVTALILGTALTVCAATVASAAPSPSSPARTAPAAAALAKAGPATQGSFEGCPSGWVCIYPFSGFNGGKPDPNLMFFTYGNHDLANVTGTHMLVDNQTGGAWDFECSGYGGTGETLNSGQGLSWGDIAFTPVNSVRLKANDNACTG